MMQQSLPHLHIVTVATERNQAVLQLLESCTAKGAKLTLLGEGRTFEGYSQKFVLLQEHLKALHDKELLLFIDGYDTLLMQPPEYIIEQFLQMNAPFVVSADKYCFPDESLREFHLASPTPFIYLNSGCYIGYVHAIREFLSALIPIDPQANDQHLMMLYMVQNRGKITLDTSCKLFLSTFECSSSDIILDRTRKSVAFQNKTTPAVIHGCRKSLWYQFLYDELFQQETLSSLPDTHTVFLSILARDNAPLIPRFLKHIDQLDYNKKNITLFIRACNSTDETKAILETWKKKRETLYQSIIMDMSDLKDLAPSLSSPQRFKIPKQLRQESLQAAIKTNCDYFFNVDCDNFIAPSTLKVLISKKKSLIAPLLKNFPPSGDLSSNFFAAVTEQGTFQDHPDYMAIRTRKKRGTFSVPLVLGSYLIQKEALQGLSYADDTFDPEYIVFARSARERGVEQYICNEQDFGNMIHLTNYPSIEEAALLDTFLQDP